MTTNPKLIFKYSKQFEKERVEYTVNKREWYIEYGYKPRLPGGKQIDDKDIKDFAKELNRLTEEEYDKNIFADLAESILDEWKWYVTNWNNTFINKTSLTFLPSYKIQLTRYGVGGSYDLPDEIYLNIEGRTPELCTSIIFHEMIHLAIESLVQKYKVSHWEKECLVDLYFIHLFPEKASILKSSEENQIIKEMFDTHEGKIDLIMKDLQKQRKNS